MSATAESSCPAFRGFCTKTEYSLQIQYCKLKISTLWHSYKQELLWIVCEYVNNSTQHSITYTGRRIFLPNWYNNVARPHSLHWASNQLRWKRRLIATLKPHSTSACFIMFSGAIRSWKYCIYSLQYYLWEVVWDNRWYAVADLEVFVSSSCAFQQCNKYAEGQLRPVLSRIFPSQA